MRDAPAPARDDRLVGRTRELAALRAWLREARAGAGRLVLCAGEAGIGKTRLAQELAGAALAAGCAVVWGRCADAEGAPPLWPWRQVLRALGTDPDAVLGRPVESPEDRFGLVVDLAAALRAGPEGLLVVLDDLHEADELSLLALRHLAGTLGGTPILVVATHRDGDAGAALPRVLPDLLRAPGAERLELRGFDLDEVREQLARSAVGEAAAAAPVVLDVTGGNPLFVREVARAIADGTWRPDRPPATVLEAVRARLGRTSPGCRRFVQAAAVAGRDVRMPVVAAALDVPVADCLPLADEAVAHGLLDPGHRFVHALTRDAVEASLPTAERVPLHRRVAEVTADQFAGALGDHLADIARHWAHAAPYGHAAAARDWAARAAAEAVRRLAYAEGARLYGNALALDAAAPAAEQLPPDERAALHAAAGRAAQLAGDLPLAVESAAAAADLARAAGRADLLAEAALVLEAVPDQAVNAVAERLCEEALAGPHPQAVRARLLALRSHLAFYAGEQDRVDALSLAALGAARAAGDDGALAAALRARQDACPGPAGRAERLDLAAQMAALAGRTGSARSAMWASLWRIEALLEGGRLAEAAEELGPMRAAVLRTGGPVAGWHLERVSGGIAQGQGRYAEADAASRRAYALMSPFEPMPSRGAFMALQAALAWHVGLSPEARGFAEVDFVSPPRFRVMSRIHRALLQVCAGLPDEAAASYAQAGPVAEWVLPAFHLVPGSVIATHVAVALGRLDDLEVLYRRLEALRGEHASGNGVTYWGPVELAMGRAAAALGRMDAAVADLEAATAAADRSGAAGAAAEARHHLAAALLARGRPGDRERAGPLAREADRVARGLGMAAYVERTGALVAALEVPPAPPAPAAGPLSAREAEVAELVAEGLTNRQIAARLLISERTAQNHVQHILTKLGFATRSQIAAWVSRQG